MNFDQAIAAHSDWKRRLAEYLRNPNRSLNATEIRLDDKCELGKWIRGDGTQFGHMAEFGQLKSAHARFHKVAADLVHRADDGENVSEEMVLGAKSDFASASSDVVRFIMALKSKIKK